MGKGEPIPVVRSISECWHRHDGDEVFVVGYGSSLIDFDWRRLNGHVVIALNDAINEKLDATYHLYSDGAICSRYWQTEYSADTLIVVQHESIIRMTALGGWKRLPQVRAFTRVADGPISGIKRETEELWVQRTVAAAGVMLAWKLGAARVYLLGIDGYRLPDTAYYANRKCSSEKHSVAYTTADGLVVEDRHVIWAQNLLTVRHYLEEQRDQYKQTIPEVWNLSARSVITAWPKKSIDEVL